MKRNGKRAISLAEICVVLAVVSVVSVVVTTFTVMVGTHSEVSTAKVQVLEELEMAETVIEGWVDHMTGQNAVFSTEDGQLKAVKDAVDYAVTLEDGLLTAPVPGGAPYMIALKTVTAITTEVVYNGTDALFFCTLTYTDPRGSDEPQTYTFCINSRIGETIQ